MASRTLVGASSPMSADRRSAMARIRMAIEAARRPLPEAKGGKRFR